MLKAQTARGCDSLQAVQLIDHGLWDHPAMDPDSCGVMGIYLPIGPWPQSEHSSLLLCLSLPYPLAFPFALILYSLRRVNYGIDATNRPKP